MQRYLETPDAQTMTVMEAGVRQRLLQHLDGCVAEVDSDLRSPPPAAAALVEESLQPPDSSTSAVEEINNNTHRNLSADSCTPLNKVISTGTAADGGNFVFVLPSHYLQLASALGINLKRHATEFPTKGSGVTGDLQRDNDADQREGDDGCEEEAAAVADKPLDFSKGNEVRDSMWRPW